MLGSIVAAGFYKFIKILEYETANPDQDMDHAAKVQRKKRLLMEAGINEVDAYKVAEELQVEAVEGKGEKVDLGNGGPDASVLANGQGRSRSDVDKEGMYGTGFRQSSSTDKTAAAPERPGVAPTQATDGQVGRYSYLGKAGRQLPSTGSGNGVRTDSPAIASPDAVFVSHDAPNEGLGDLWAGSAQGQMPRNRFARTASSGV